VSKNNYTLPLDRKLKNLKGEDTEIHLGELIADAIAGCGAEQCKTLKPGKLIGWAMALAAHESLTLDETDFDSLREFVGLLPRLNILVLAQADTCFKSAKDSKAV
jgi:hypothetical protein